jgi:parallel beta-helix repeat protein
MAMKKKREKNRIFKARRTTSAVITCLLVTSGFLMLFPISVPTVEAPLVHNASAQWEDQDFGGGLDYNGDPAGDGIVTWHTVNNSHIVDNNFFVEDGYALELEAGVVVHIDPGFVIQVGQTTGASIYSNGTLFAPVMIQQNSSGSPWGGIYLIEGSNAYMEFTGITGGGLIYVLNSTLEMNYCGIAMMNSYGILSSGSTVSITHCGIAYTAQQGIAAIGSTLSVTNSYIADTLMTAIYMDSSNAIIDKNEIYGFNASAGLGGGHAIYLTGFSMSVTITNNTIIGGKGGDDVSGGGGGAGGNAVFDSGYEGQLRVIDNFLIQGGNGGNNIGSFGTAGNGGIGVHVSPISDFVPSPSVEISGNDAIIGGKGGDNNAALNGINGEGGEAVYIVDNPPGSAGNAKISNNINIIGGDGGHNHANIGIPGWESIRGGNGILIGNAQNPCSVNIEGNPNIAGGKGGNNTGAGTIQAGDGGSGILIWDSSNVKITQCTMMGGDGGNNTETGIGAFGGNGGSGVVLWTQTPPFISQADIVRSLLIGGEGGDDWVGLTPMQGGPGRGGNGLYSSGSTGTCTSLDMFGGKGGDNYGFMGIGGSGGYGLGISGSIDWAVSTGTITGGKGGNNFHTSGRGGNGDSAVYIGDNSNNITLSDILNIVGGDGGDSDVGLGPGDAAQTTIYASASSDVNILHNIITTGTGGYNASSGAYGQNGSFCLYGTDISGSNSIIANDITARDRSGNTWGIRLNLSVSIISSMVIADNDIYNNNVGVHLLDCNAVKVGDTNRIYANFIGIHLENADVNVGTGNTISDNDYGIYSHSSNPIIFLNQIINSSQVGLRFTYGSTGTVEECSIIDSGVWSVYCDGGIGPGSSPEFYNCTVISKPTARDFYIADDSHPWLLNTTFDKSKTIFGDIFSNITVNWFMHVLVIDTNYIGVDGATVWINDTYGTNLEIRITDGTGWTRWIVVTEYVQNLTGYEYYYTPHDVSAVEGGRFGKIQSSMTLSKEVIIMLNGISFEIILKKGWNMISIPIPQTNNSLEEVLKYIDGNYLAVQWFNASDSEDEWKHYYIGKIGMNDLSNINRQMGIWIFMKSDDILPVFGELAIPMSSNIDLKAGWNFVGYPSMTTRIAGNGTGEAFEFISSYVDMVQHYDAFDPSNPWKAWDPGIYSQDDLIEVKPGNGLWIHVTGDCTWNVNW